MILPDTSSMVAEVKINEALTGLITPGLRVTVTCDAAPENLLTGKVESIGVLAESGDWQDPNRRDYAVRILLDVGQGRELKPSMRCQADIRIDEVVDAVNVPIQAIHRTGSNIFVYVPESGGFSQRRVTVDRSSELYVEIVDGLKPGDQVLLREPSAEEIVAKLPPSRAAEAQSDGSEESLAEERLGLPAAHPTTDATDAAAAPDEDDPGDEAVVEREAGS